MGILSPEEEQELQSIKLSRKKNNNSNVEKETITPEEYNKRLEESLKRDSHVYSSTRNKQIEKASAEWRKKVGPRFADATTENPVVLDRVRRLEHGTGTHKTSIVMSGNLGVGKAQPLTEKVLTIKGWKKLGAIKQGDVIISGKGTPTVVKAVHPVKERMVYTVTFDDDTTVEADGEHLWLTFKGYGRHETLTTSQISESLNEEHQIPIVGNINIPDSSTMDDEAITNAVFECLENNTPFRKNPAFKKTIKTVKKGLHMKPKTAGKINWILGLTVDTREKIIKEIFTREGILNTKTQAEASFNSMKLAEEVAEMLRSLGAHTKTQHSSDIVTVTTRTPFQLFNDYKQKLYKPLQRQEITKKIVKVEAKKYAKTRCITVAANSHTYVTSGYTVTHNTWLAHAYISQAIQSGAVTPGQIVADTETAILSKISSSGFRRVELLEELLHPRYKIYFIDDVGQGYFSNEQGRKEVWYELLDHVYAHDLTLIITTNKEFMMRGGKIAGSPALENWIGVAAYDRLRHIVGSDGVIIPGNVNRRPGVYEKREEKTNNS